MKISEHANYLLNEYGRLQFGEPVKNGRVDVTIRPVKSGEALNVTEQILRGERC